MRGAAIVAILLASTPALAERDLCTPNTKHAGKPIDVDLEHAELGDALRFLADVAKVNLVISDDVSGRVSLHLKQVAWDQAACAIAATSQLSLALDGNILLVRPSAAKR